jgi:hypothetical protein
VASAVGAAEHGLSGGTEWLLMGVSVATAAAGLLLARSWYVKQQGRPAERVGRTGAGARGEGDRKAGP